jgi:hypothetical protein
MREKVLHRLAAIISGSQLESKYVLEDVFWVPITNCKSRQSTPDVLPKLHPKKLDTGELSDSILDKSHAKS